MIYRVHGHYNIIRIDRLRDIFSRSAVRGLGQTTREEAHCTINQQYNIQYFVSICRNISLADFGSAAAGRNENRRIRNNIISIANGDNYSKNKIVSVLVQFRLQRKTKIYIM